MQKHIEVLGWLYIAYYCVFLLVGIVAFVLLLGIAAGIAIAPDIEPEVSAILSVIGLIAGFFYLLLAAPGIIGGVGLLKKQNWARILVIILSFLNLVAFPFGTALGIYALWVLLKEETAQLFNGNTARNIQV